MKRNSTFLAKALTLLFVALFSLTGARAETLTVHDGTTTNSYVPVYGYWADASSRSQFVYQVADIQDMVNSEITGMTFYASQSSVNWGAAEFDVYLSEISQTSISALKDWSTLQKVYSGSLSISGQQMTITFDTPYVYGGGNLLVGINQTTSGSYSQSTWYGQEVSGASMGGYNTSIIQRDFIPKTTFTYQQSTFLRPTNVTASNITTNAATISWNGDANSYNVRYRAAAAEQVSFFEDFENGLEAQGWTTIRSSNGNEYTDWRTVDASQFTGGSNHNGDYVVMSRSWSNSAFSVDNWLITPKVTLGGFLKYWVMDDGTYHEHYDIYVSTTTTDISAFTKVFEPGDATDSWTEVSVDLSSFAGQEGYIAFRLTDNDKDYLWIDDISISSTVPAGAWTTINTTETSTVLTGLNPETDYEVQVQAVYADGESQWVSTSFTTASATAAPTDLAATDVMATSATLDWAGYQESYNLQYREVLPIDPSAPATIIFTADDVWGDGSGYQMLLDADATAFGTIIPESGALTSSGDVSAATYAEFEYKIPENADGALTTENIVIDNSITIQIPAGTYDWCITNPTIDDRMWIASGNGNVGGRYDDYVFEAGKTYEFHVYLKGSNDATDVTITYPVSEWTVVENVTAPYELTGLTPETNYEWQVQGILSDGTTEWSELSSFTTPEITTIPVAISSVGYSTLYYGTLNLVVPEGVTAYTYSYNGTKIEESKTYNEGEVIPAGTGVVLEANAGTYDFVVTTEAGEADANNALRGSDEAEQTTGGDVYYALSLKDGANIGFYWMAEGGAAFTNGAHKAYLALTNTKVKGFAIGLEDDATAIETIANGQQTTEGAIYNVAGQRLNKAQKGVNIVNGKKIAIK